MMNDADVYLHETILEQDARIRKEVERLEAGYRTGTIARPKKESLWPSNSNERYGLDAYHRRLDRERVARGLEPIYSV